jgi:hypothetical protein
VPCAQSLRDEVEITVQVNQLYLRAEHELRPIGLFQGGACEDNRLPRCDPISNRIVQRLEPRGPIRVIERNAGTHLGDTGCGVKVVRISKGPSEFLGKLLPDRGLSDTANSHEQNDHDTFLHKHG